MQTRTRRRLPARPLIVPARDRGRALVGARRVRQQLEDESSNNGSSSGAVTLRLGYFPNVTHAPAIIGVQNGTFAAKLGPDVKLDLKTFNSGTEATTALLAGAIDASFVGPNPAINAYQKTKGDIRVVAGTASGGASFVVKPGDQRARPT